MKVVSLAVVKRQAAAAKAVTVRRAGRAKDDAEVAGYRRQLRTFIKRLEKTAQTGEKDEPARLLAVQTLAALVLAMFVAEHDLRQDIHRAVDATLVA